MTKTKQRSQPSSGDSLPTPSRPIKIKSSLAAGAESEESGITFDPSYPNKQKGGRGPRTAPAHHTQVVTQFMVSTARKRALPLIICSNASATFSSGNFSIIGRTPVSMLNRSEERRVGKE